MISCASHDYFESACVYHYDLLVELKHGECFSGRAETISCTDKQEFLHLVVQTETILLNLEDIKAVRVQTLNARFSSFEP
jgi:transcriptional antiterminator Rof (Rho-off)